jgi:hypothetical protein
VQAKAAAEHSKLIDAWGQRVKAAKAEMPDFDDMISSTDVTVSNEVRDAIFESDVGPRILYHLAENPDLRCETARHDLNRRLTSNWEIGSAVRKD